LQDGTVAAGVAGLGTLLGPEGTGACAWVFWVRLVSRHTAPVIHLLVGGLGLVAVWVPGLFVF
jgi:hypothetical protein